ncbi:Hint domain-containing protein [Thalassobius sp. I31.1]|uniref:Hint domain-containing protein n=1 Tax=Thalassobius sp. I31.1 TaxID=2109912 RepID=UPI001E3BF187|nr:Hint domain-containing protein [Thalassobius sp. I31.1]
MAHHVITTSGTYFLADGDTVDIQGISSGTVILNKLGSEPNPNPEVEVTVSGDLTNGAAVLVNGVSTDFTVSSGVDMSEGQLSFTKPLFGQVPSSHSIHIEDNAHIGKIVLQSRRDTEVEITSGDGGIWGADGANVAVIDSQLAGERGNSLNVELGDNNIIQSQVWLQDADYALKNLEINGATFSGLTSTGVPEASISLPLGYHPLGDSPVINADNLTVNAGYLYSSGFNTAKSEEIFLRGLNHDVWGLPDSGLADSGFGILRLEGGDDTLHLGGDLTTNDLTYHVHGGQGNDTLDFQFVSAAQKQEFIDSFVAAGGTYDPMTDTFGDATGLTWSISQQDGTGTVTFSQFENVSVSTMPSICFARGTLIKTIDGDVPIETLSVGDLVLTQDNGYQPIRWLGSRHLSYPQLLANPKLLPVEIKAGALGEGLPLRDLKVSRQHRLLVRSEIAQRMFNDPEVLISAIKLCKFEEIKICMEAKEVDYYHMLFDRHQIVFAEGTPAESLFTGKEALKLLSPAAKREIFTLFPELSQQTSAPMPARHIPDGRKQNKLVERHLAKQRKLMMSLAS